MLEQLAGLGARQVAVAHRRVELRLDGGADRGLDVGEVLALRRGDGLERPAVAQPLEELGAREAERLGGRVDARAAARPAGPAAVVARPGPPPPSTRPERSRACWIRSACSCVIRPAGDLRVELGVLRRAERVAQLAGLDAELLRRLVEDGLLALRGVAGAGGRHRGPGAGGDECGRGGEGDDAFACHMHDYRGRLWDFPETVPPADVHRIALPTPFQIGDVNTYLLRGSPLTLVDAGPLMEEAEARLEEGLAERGVGVADLELLVLTHQHDDHVGLAGELVRRSGADVAGSAGLRAYLADIDASMEADDAYAVALMRRHGVSERTIETLGGVSRAFRRFAGGDVAVTVELRDGGELTAGGRRWTVAERPGHSPTDTTLTGGRPARLRRPPAREDLLQPDRPRPDRRAGSRRARRLARAPAHPRHLPRVAGGDRGGRRRRARAARPR